MTSFECMLCGWPSIQRQFLWEVTARLPHNQHCTTRLCNHLAQQDQMHLMDEITNQSLFTMVIFLLELVECLFASKLFGNQLVTKSFFCGERFFWNHIMLRATKLYSRVVVCTLLLCTIVSITPLPTLG